MLAYKEDLIVLNVLSFECSSRPAVVWWSLHLCRWPGQLCWQGWASAGWNRSRPCRCESRGHTDTARWSRSAVSWPACEAEKKAEHLGKQQEKNSAGSHFSVMGQVWVCGSGNNKGFVVMRLTRCFLGFQSVCRVYPTCLHCLWRKKKKKTWKIILAN